MYYMHNMHVKGKIGMSEKAAELPKIHHVQVKLSDEEYELFDELAHEARMKPTAYARHIFLGMMKKEQVRLGIATPSRKRGPW